jgi:Fatty acid cis/trans isomerase (CTI)
MKCKYIFTLIILLTIAGCAGKTLPPVAVKIPTRTIDYQKEIKPLLEKRCTVCHSCYNSPCQLKLDSFAGVDRGANRKAIYNALRLKSMEPTRLFTDAQTTEEWRKKQFFSVTSSTATEGFNDSLMIQLLSHKMKNPKSTGGYKPDAEDLTCAENNSELAEYLEKHPNKGMPYGFPPLKQDEFDLVAGWLYQGAKGPSPVELLALETPQAADAAEIVKWERFFNQDDPKHAMTARYIYEHLFLAHIKFGTATNEFYEIVRSITPPGKPLELIPTVRPYDDPGVVKIYYRFRKIHSTIVEKTHMVYELDDARLERYRELFIKPNWLQPPHLVSYDPKLSANPFKAFEQIPARSRYQFMLDSSEYFIMTFIHGPVCKGQVALNVIDEQFWVLFMDPEFDLAVKYPGLLKLQSDRLAMPTESGSDQRLLTALTDKHSKLAIDYYNARQDYYQALNYSGLSYDAIWKGKGATDAPLLTIYRHFDSASVHKGPLGNLPKTLWVIDYPLLERLYYALVAGFDIYGTAGHQLTARLYMDRLRIEGESYFLNFMPPEKRLEIMQSWYLKTDFKDIKYNPSDIPAGVRFSTTDPKREFVENLIDNYLLKTTGIRFDPMNYLKAGETYPPLPTTYASPQDYLDGFRAVSRPGTPFVALVNNANANLAYLRVRTKAGKDYVITSVVNRWHDNVAFMLAENGRLDPTKDNVEFVMGMIGSYPNFFFDIKEDDLPDFFDLMMQYDGSPQSIKRLSKYGINRSDDRFWETYDWFQQKFIQDEPVTGGLLDLNRYYYLAE